MNNYSFSDDATCQPVLAWQRVLAAAIDDAVRGQRQLARLGIALIVVQATTCGVLIANIALRWWP